MMSGHQAACTPSENSLSSCPLSKLPQHCRRRGLRASSIPAGLKSVQLFHEPLRVVGVVLSRINARTARRGETAERRDALRPLPGAGLPQIGTDERLRTMLKRLFDSYD